MDKTNRNLFVFALIAFALTIAAYANHFNNGFHFDDFHAVVENAYIRSLKNIPSFFTDPKMFSSDPSHWGLRPLVTTTLAIDYWLGGGLYPSYFQTSTFIWHIALCIILFFLYRSILKTTFNLKWAGYMAITAAAIYALHTANAETLNYIISRSDVQSTFMIVASLHIYIAWPHKRKYGFYLIPAILGVFAKETVPVLIIILFFYITLFEKQLSVAGLFKPKNFRLLLGALLQVLPLTIVVGAVQIYTLSRVSGINGMTNPLLPYMLTQTFVWVHYFIAFFLPLNLSADTDWAVIQNVFDERIIIGCVFIIALIVAIFKTSSKAETRPITFGLIWFAAALLPTSVIPFNEVTNDHRMYFPFIGLALSVVCYAGVLLKRHENYLANKRHIAYLVTFILGVLCLNAFGVYERNKVWKDEESLWRDVTIKSPNNGRGLMNYGVALMGKGDYARAGNYFKMALHFMPSYSTIYINIGLLDGYTGKLTEAEQNLRTAIALDPANFSPYAYFSQFLLMHGRINEAQAMAEKALKLNPYSEQVMNTLMSIYCELENWNALQNTAAHFLNIWPANPNARLYLKAAHDHISTILDADSNNDARLPVTAADYLNLSLKYYNNGLYLKCIDACNKALQLKPDYADAYNNIGAAYIKLKQWSNGIAACKKALAINPKHVLANGNLKFAESELNK